MDSKQIRNTFLDFFKEKGHELVPSAPIVIKDDPTLLFTNAGMNQFKEAFLGNAAPKFNRIVDTQKCLRVSGKHNDLEEVGVDTYHHTMFEMLGNWSFGDFFKAEMIPWAWELLTERYKLDKDRLYVTVFEGDKEDQLEQDIEALETWSKIVDPNRIILASKKDNFWEMGETGPCGPCSEIHIDLRSEKERNAVDGKTLVNKDHPQVVEIWNLVFMEFNRLKDRSLVHLPQKHVDTGMGFERLCMALQKKTSNYDTDVFGPSLREMEKITGLQYGASDSKQDIAFRVIVDHIRAIAFSIADGQLPSNTGAGYVIRRILRRAVRYAYSFLNTQEPFLYKLIDSLIFSLGDTFPELLQQKNLIEKVIHEEENSFLSTLEKGIQLFEDMYEKKKHLGAFEVDGEFAFELYDTYGFPIDLTQLMAHEKGLTVGMKSFEEALKKQKDRSRAASKIDAQDWVIVLKDEVEEFVGYDYLEATVKITRYRKVNQKGKDFYQLVFNLSPFYPEGGGQVGDVGSISTETESIEIFDTKKENNLIIHFANELPQQLNGVFKAQVDVEKRNSTASNHSATHLLHEALREVLGTHVEQKGSLVNAAHLRFDFSHFQKVSPEELKTIELKVNQKIRANLPLQEDRFIPIEEAKKRGAMALFGEKYGDVVRLIQFGTSVELCGGIHVPSTGTIGSFKINAESAVAAGVRRIEAISSDKAEAFYAQQTELLHEIKVILKNPKDVMTALQSLLDDNQRMQKEIEELKSKAAGNVKEDLIKQVQNVNGINQLIALVDLDPANIKDIAFQLKGEIDDLFAVLGSKKDDKPSLTVLLSDSLVNDKKMHAGNIIRELAKHIQGGGGGQAFFATAGGKNVQGLDAALEAAKGLV